ncbi:MAG: response regulator [Alphaproteobacteria bacterium]
MAAVLIIDDDPRIRELWSSALSKAGFSVHAAGSGARGIEIVKTEQVDVAIIDLIMPDKDGIETLLEIKSARPDMKVLAVSGGGEILNASYVDIADRLGADATLRKPVSIDRLCRVVAELAAGK